MTDGTTDPRSPLGGPAPSHRPLQSRTVIVTRQEPGELAAGLVAAGAEVMHLPLIEIADPVDGGAALADALSDLGDYSWLIVTSPNGARRVAEAGASIAPGALSEVQLAAVGRGTASTLRELTGRRADLVPAVQRIEGLLAEFPSGGGRILAARGNRADPSLVDGLEALGWSVDDVVAYRTVACEPSGDDRARIERADAVTFASGSAVEAWVDAFGSNLIAELGLKVVVIGPSTARVAADAGIDVTNTAPHHSIEGLVQAVVTTLTT